MVCKALIGAAALGLIGLIPIHAKATPVTVDQLYEFAFGVPTGALLSGTGTVATTNPTAAIAPDPAWTFTLAAPATLTVLDLFLSVDQFEIFDFGGSLGTTSTPIAGSDCGTDVGCALLNTDFSRGVFLLASGNHSITGTHILGQAGAGVFLITTPVPLPTALPLFVSAIGTLGALGRWRRRRSG